MDRATVFETVSLWVRVLPGVLNKLLQETIMKFEMQYVKTFPYWISFSIDIEHRFFGAIQFNVLPEIGVYLSMIGDAIVLQVGAIFINLIVGWNITGDDEKCQ